MKEIKTTVDVTFEQLVKHLGPSILSHAVVLHIPPELGK